MNAWRGLRAVVGTIAVWVFAAIFWSGFLSLYLLALRQLPDRWFVWASRFWASASLRLIGIRLEVNRPNPWDEAAPRVIICNHQSGLDLIWGAGMCPARVLAIGKKEVIWVPIVNVIWWAFRFIRIDRGNTAKALEALQGVSERVVAEKRSLILAPEGTRTRNGRFAPFKKGAFQIARRGDIPIHPVVVQGAFELMPRGSWLMRPGTIRMRYMEPVRGTGAWTDAELEERIGQLHSEMVRVFVELGGKA
ncbi:MAG: 1-acyl-sn-glycerol-3-phosphate acyltransferase [Bdellovibrionales bacterium]|nr:1-acyl-sn-glycerol-3-phosphate acyltransferase [Bdellovibrionales bacterium]